MAAAMWTALGRLGGERRAGYLRDDCHTAITDTVTQSWTGQKLGMFDQWAVVDDNEWICRPVKAASMQEVIIIGCPPCARIATGEIRVAIGASSNTKSAESGGSAVIRAAGPPSTFLTPIMLGRSIPTQRECFSTTGDVRPIGKKG